MCVGFVRDFCRADECLCLLFVNEKCSHLVNKCGFMAILWVDKMYKNEFAIVCIAPKMIWHKCENNLNC